MAKTAEYRLSPIEKEKQLTSVKYLLIKMRLSQKEAAAALGVCPHTISRIVKKYGLKNAIKEAKEQGIKNGVKWDDSLTAFIVHTRIHNKATYAVIEPVYKQFLKTL